MLPLMDSINTASHYTCWLYCRRYQCFPFDDYTAEFSCVLQDGTCTNASIYLARSIHMIVVP